MPGRGAAGADHLAGRVEAALGSPVFVVHRLDQATSGLMLLALTAGVQRVLNLAFAERRVHKRYIAIVDGWPAYDEGCIDLPLAADWPHRPRQRVSLDGGKPSETRWRVLERIAPSNVLEGRRSRMTLQPITGRSHQLRVHLSAIGHPIVGDALYAAGPQAAQPRLLLHASELGLEHPVDGRPLNFHGPVPF